MRKSLYIFLILFSCTIALAQQVNYGSKITLPIGNGQSVTAFASSANSSVYYYLPANLILSYTQANVPEFLLMIYGNDTKDIKGGVLHFLFKWGLSKAQIDKANASLKGARLETAMNVTAGSITPNFNITGKPQQIVDVLKRSIGANPPFPTMAHDKTAIAVKFSADDAKIMKTFADNPQTLKDVKIELSFDYYAQEGNLSKKHNHILSANLGYWFIEALKFNECYKK